MDDDVRRAIAKWPTVPACYGWLALDRRGRWRMRDEHAQQHGLLGDIVRNPTLKRFIDRNYERTLHGEWFFQNGPQRVFVNIEAAPFVLFVEPAAPNAPLRIDTHTGAEVREVLTAYIDEHGHFYLAFDAGRGEQLGLVCDRDLSLLLEHLSGPDGLPPDTQQTLDLLAEAPFSLYLELPQAAHALHLHSVHTDDLPGRFDYVRRPVAPRDLPN